MRRVRVGLVAAIAMLGLILACGSSGDSTQPDLSNLLAPKGSDACAERLPVDRGTVHVLVVTHLRATGMTTCDSAAEVLKVVPGTPKLERSDEIRGKLKCQVIGYPQGKDSDQIAKWYVFVDRSTDAQVKAVCDQLKADAAADPVDEYRSF